MALGLLAIKPSEGPRIGVSRPKSRFWVICAWIDVGPGALETRHQELSSKLEIMSTAQVMREIQAIWFQGYGYRILAHVQLPYRLGNWTKVLWSQVHFQVCVHVR